MMNPEMCMECACSRELRFRPSNERIECDCGAVYAVAVTKIRRGEEE